MWHPKWPYKPLRFWEKFHFMSAQGWTKNPIFLQKYKLWWRMECHILSGSPLWFCSHTPFLPKACIFEDKWDFMFTLGHTKSTLFQERRGLEGHLGCHVKGQCQAHSMWHSLHFQTSPFLRYQWFYESSEVRIKSQLFRKIQALGRNGTCELSHKGEPDITWHSIRHQSLRFWVINDFLCEQKNPTPNFHPNFLGARGHP